MAHRPKIKVFHGRPAEIEAKFTLWAEEQMGCASIISVTQSASTWKDRETVTLAVIYEEDETAVSARLAAALEEDSVPGGGVEAIIPLPGNVEPLL
jgi:hypothetical protein